MSAKPLSYTMPFSGSPDLDTMPWNVVIQPSKRWSVSEAGTCVCWDACPGQALYRSVDRSPNAKWSALRTYRQEHYRDLTVILRNIYHTHVYMQS